MSYLILTLVVLILLSFLYWHAVQRVHRKHSDLSEYGRYVEVLHSALKQERHDQRSHLQILDHMAEQKDYSQIRDYISILLENKDDDTPASTYSIGPLGASLAYVVAQGEQDEIKVTSEIKANMNEYSLSASKEMQLFVNIFSNALKAARQSKDYTKEPFINFELRKQFGILIIDIRNSTPPIAEETLAKLYPSTHPGVDKRGLGTYIIASNVAKADGTLNYHVENNVFHLAIRLPSVG